MLLKHTVSVLCLFIFGWGTEEQRAFSSISSTASSAPPIMGTGPDEAGLHGSCSPSAQPEYEEHYHSPFYPLGFCARSMIINQQPNQVCCNVTKQSIHYVATRQDKEPIPNTGKRSWP